MKHAAAALVLCAAGQAGATPLLITGHSYTLHSDTHIASFELVFNRVPDFLHADPIGRQADAFWFDMDTDMDAATGLYAPWYPEPLGIDRRISAYEIWNTGALVVHDQAFGPVLGSLPYTIAGATMQFDVDYALLAIPAQAGGVYYAVNVEHYGGTTQSFEVVPMPPAVGMGMVGLVGAWVARERRRVGALNSCRMCV